MTDPRAGFSLVELLVVTTIISLLSFGMVVGLGTGGIIESSASDDAEGRARSLENAVIAARDRAILMRRLHALVPRQDGWVIHHFGMGEWQETVSAKDGSLIDWSIAGMPVLFHAETSASDAPARILILEDGRTAAFTAAFRSSGKTVHCATDGWETFQCRVR